MNMHGVKKKSIEDDNVYSIDELYPESYSVVKKINFDIKNIYFEKLKASNHTVEFTWLLAIEPNNTIQISAYNLFI